MLSSLSRINSISNLTIRYNTKTKIPIALSLSLQNNSLHQVKYFHTHILEVTKKHINKDTFPKQAIINPDGTSMTYKEIHRRAFALSQELLKRHPLTSSKVDLKEKRIAFLCEPSSSYIINLFSIWGAGGVAVPIHYKFPSAEIEYLLEEAEVSFLLCDKMNQFKVERLTSELRKKVPFFCSDRFTKVKRFLVDAERLEKKRMRSNVGLTWEASNYSRDRGAYILFTSGTTGTPKGVVMTHGNVMSQIENINTAWEISSNDRLLHFLPLHHVHGLVNNLLSPLTAGATVEFTGTHKPVPLWEKLQEGNTTVFMAVPTIYHNLIQVIKDTEVKKKDAPILSDKDKALEGLKSLRLTISGSMACPLNILQYWKKLTGHTMLERYGMTEIGMALTQPLHGERVPGCVGQPFPTVEVKIIDPETRKESDKEGELYVKGPSVFQEYYKLPGVTKESFDADGWFATGDIVKYHKDSNNFQILGRASVDIIKSGGYKLSALEIESILLLHPDVLECCVVGVDDEKYGQVVVAIIKFNTDDMHAVKAALDKVNTYAKLKLAYEKIPKAWIVVSDFNRNPMGKIDKKHYMEIADEYYHKKEHLSEVELRDPNQRIPGVSQRAMRGDYPI